MGSSSVSSRKVGHGTNSLATLRMIDDIRINHHLYQFGIRFCALNFLRKGGKAATVTHVNHELHDELWMMIIYKIYYIGILT